MCSIQELSKILYDSALTYLNIDTAVSGHDHISVAATPLLYKATYKAAKMVNTASLLMLGSHLKIVLLQLLLWWACKIKFSLKVSS